MWKAAADTAREMLRARKRPLMVTRRDLFHALSTNGNPSFATILRVLNALGPGLYPAPKAVSQLSPRSS